MGVSEFVCFLEPMRADMPEDPTPQEAEVLAAHFAYCRSLLGAGVLTLAGRTLEPPVVGLLIFEANSIAEAEEIVANDPAVRGGVFRARVQPYRVALSRANPSA